MAEVQANNQRVQELATEQGWKVAQNVAAGVAGFVVPVLWFGMDWQGAAGRRLRLYRTASSTSPLWRSNAIAVARWVPLLAHIRLRVGLRLAKTPPRAVTVSGLAGLSCLSR